MIDLETKQEGNTILVKLSDGEDLFPGLEAACRKHGVENGAVMWGIGMLKDFEVGFYGPAGYEKRTFEGRHELIALHGSIAMDAEPRLHLHVAVGRADHTVHGGHLFRARTCMVNEICLVRFEAIRLRRVLNEGTKLRELVLEP